MREKAVQHEAILLEEREKNDAGIAVQCVARHEVITMYERLQWPLT